MSEDRATFELDEPGFHGTLDIFGPPTDRRILVSGTRPDGNDTAVQKELPADRDQRLTELVERCLQGDAGAAAEVLAHVGVLDP